MMISHEGLDRAPTSDEVSDEELAFALSSDAERFTILYERYYGRILRFVRAHVPDATTAEDVTAQVFCKVFTSASTFRNEGSFEAWLFTIARNTIATRLGRLPRGEVSLEAVEEEPDGAATPLMVTLAGEELDEVNRTVEALPEAQREVVRLRYWRELSIDEIATSTRRSSGAVRQLLHRARRHLAKHLSRKDLTVLLGATGASAVATYSYRRLKKEKR